MNWAMTAMMMVENRFVGGESHRLGLCGVRVRFGGLFWRGVRCYCLWRRGVVMDGGAFLVCDVCWCR